MADKKRPLPHLCLACSHKWNHHLEVSVDFQVFSRNLLSVSYVRKHFSLPVNKDITGCDESKLNIKT